MIKTRLRNDKGQYKKASKVSEFGFVNLSTYTSPEIKEVNGEDWIEYGADNNYFQYLIDRYNGSPTNNAAINGISQAIYGKGINATDGNRKPNEYAQMISLFKKDVVRKLCYDLKLMGQCAVQIIYSKDRKRIAQIEHMPIETLRAEKCNDDGDIPAYYYFKDWANIKRSDDPLRIPAYGMSKENIEIYYIKPYKSGFYYYSPVDYQGGLQYAELEEEVSNYHLNNIMNGLAPSMLINFNNGTPNQEERQLIETKIAAKFSGSSNAGKFILAFNDNKESQAEITPVQLSDAHNQYQFLSEEAQSKIQVAHRVVSPFLLGIRTSTGFSSNADEIKTASLLMDNTVIRPFQELLIDAFDNILAFNEISLNLYFTTLQPLEFTEVDSDIQDKEDIEEETGVKMEKLNLKMIDGKQAYKTKEEAEIKAKEMGCESSHEHEIEGVIYYMPCISHEELKEPCWDGYEQYGTKMKDGKEVPNCIKLSNIERVCCSSDSEDDDDEVAKKLIALGEDIDETKWEPVFDQDVDYQKEDKIDEIISELNSQSEEKLSLLGKMWKFVSTGVASPNKPSEQDKKIGENYFKVRYYYSPRKVGDNARRFCKAMKGANKVYRKEDIIRMGKEPVNKGWGPKGDSAMYSIWLYKGGGNCHHSWRRITYKSKEAKINLRDAQDIIGTRQAAILGYKVTNPYQVSIQPRNLPNKGFLPGNPQGN
tara:strand:- start:1079 stop:3196 length:2118 start_codon:yes stop_codon:yes gene_type:complete